MLASDPRADPGVIDLIELAGLWLAADDRPALARSLERLVELLGRRFPAESGFRERFLTLLAVVRDGRTSAEELRRCYRRATLG
jgi:hypothetical protein